MLQGKVIHDLVCIGAGAAGLTVAHAASSEMAGAKLAVFEASKRDGGRIQSVKLGAASFPVEMGAASISDAHELAVGLITHLGIVREELNFREGGRFLRGVASSPQETCNQSTYRLSETEAQHDPRALILDTIGKIAPEAMAIWRSAPSAAAAQRSVAEALNNARSNGQLLSEQGLWNVFSAHATHEAHDLISALLGSTSALRNAHAANAIATLLFEAHPSQRHFVLPGGMSQLANGLVVAAAPEVRFEHGWRLKAVTLSGDIFRLSFDCSGGTRGEVLTRTAVLGLPKAALKQIMIDERIAGAQLQRDFDAVHAVPVCKLFLAFDRPWWADAGLVDHTDRAVYAWFTDMPMRQCYFFPARQSGPAAMMACFADDVWCDYWSALASPGARSDAHACPYTAVSPAMIARALDQLRKLHPRVQIQEPTLAFFVDWSGAPFGGGWHAWKPGVRSYEVAERVLQPNPDLPFFICGEAYSHTQGWIEGALDSAMAVGRRLGFSRPAWARADRPLQD